MIVQRGFPQPPSLHEQRLRDAPVGHFFDVITNGYGVMYPYASRVSPDDRWAIAAYIRALQLSQHATPADADAAERETTGDAHQKMNDPTILQLQSLADTRTHHRRVSQRLSRSSARSSNHAQFFHSYLFAWLFWVGLSFGALVIVMMQFADRRALGLGHPQSLSTPLS